MGGLLLARWVEEDERGWDRKRDPTYIIHEITGYEKRNYILAVALCACVRTLFGFFEDVNLKLRGGPSIYHV